MLVGIGIQNFKGIQSLDYLELGLFHVLAGPNASGKTTFLDALRFVRDCVDKCVSFAVENQYVRAFDEDFFSEIAFNRSISPE